jgi:hypothetical protein
MPEKIITYEKDGSNYKRKETVGNEEYIKKMDGQSLESRKSILQSLIDGHKADIDKIKAEIAKIDEVLK